MKGSPADRHRIHSPLRLRLSIGTQPEPYYMCTVLLSNRSDVERQSGICAITLPHFKHDTLKEPLMLEIAKMHIDLASIFEEISKSWFIDDFDGFFEKH